MLKLTIAKDKAPEFECNLEDLTEIPDYAKSFGQSLVELINWAIPQFEENNEEKLKTVIALIRQAKSVAYFKMKALGWVGDTTSLEDLFSLDDVA